MIKIIAKDVFFWFTSTCAVFKLFELKNDASCFFMVYLFYKLF